MIPASSPDLISTAPQESDTLPQDDTHKASIESSGIPSVKPEPFSSVITPYEKIEGANADNNAYQYGRGGSGQQISNVQFNSNEPQHQYNVKQSSSPQRQTQQDQPQQQQQQQQQQQPLPYTFRPADRPGGCSNMLSDMLDLNDIFAEEFYPADVDFSKYLSMMNANGMMAMDNTSTAGDMMNDERWSPAGFDLVSLASTDTNQHSLCYPGERPSAGAAFIGTGMSLPMGSYSTSAGGLSSMTQSGAMKLTGATTKNDVILIPPTLPRHVPAPASSITSATTAMPPPSADVKAASGNKRSASSMLRDSGGKARASSTYHGKGDSVDGQRFERRERNREHAKRSRVRKKLLLDSLQDQLLALRQENMNLRRVVTDRLPHVAPKILADCTTPESSLLASLNNDSDSDPQQQQQLAPGGRGDDVPSSSTGGMLKPSPLTSNIAQNMMLTAGGGMLKKAATAVPVSSMKQNARILMEPDYRLIQSLVTSQQNFVLSDPSLPDNPIVYASEGFCRMTGYKRQDVLGRNCRFLQGPGTDQAAVDLIRQGIAEGRDISVCLLNYKADGKAFWNQFFLAALKDADGQVVNYVGVQCEVNTIPVLEIKDRVKKLPIPTEL